MARYVNPILMTLAFAAGAANLFGQLGTPNGMPAADMGDTGRAIMISGSVAMEDGSPVPRNLPVKSVCSGVERIVTYTHADGKFDFRWGSSTALQANASQSDIEVTTTKLGLGGLSSKNGTSLGGASGDQITNCELAVNLAGYRSSTINLYNHSSTSSPNVGVIVLRKLGSDEGVFVSATAAQAPKDARKAWDEGLVSLQKNQRPEALASFQKAVKIYPTFADAWVRIGILQAQLKQMDAATESFKKAMEIDSRLIAPWQELGFLASARTDWPETAKYLDTAVKLDPNTSPRAWYLDATAHFNLKHYDEAEKSIRRAIELDPKHLNPRADFLLGLVLIAKEDYKGGSEALKAYIAASPNAGDLDMVRGELARIQEFIK